ncbi:hypothetical protein KJ657_05445 [Patescibacteria group bacterium]|nr:hypothetical protein [Patescibacteria group bacterium]MBU1016502.1 hypothetical protein [Patescibacteria group bacterium]MBU1685119.1 hypothetical protein [Patescibacteria group bacterium]MBU1938619.1 hypothetical protein [Patescibacteria group bacterium]
MTVLKKDTVWITIPDEATSAAVNKVALKSPKGETYKVRNRVFWGGGFVALVIFLTVLLVPQEFAGLMQAQLFDGTLKVVPDYEKQQEGALFGGKQEEGAEQQAEAEKEKAADEAVIQAESEAVTIQVEPVTEIEGGEEAVSDMDKAAAVTGAESVVIDEADKETETVDVAEAVVEGAESLDANAKLLQALSKQLEDFKEKQKQSDQQIQDLMQLLTDQAAGLHGAGIAQPSAVFIPGGQSDQFGAQGAMQAGAGAGAGGGVYRYNTHTVTVSPYDVLAQNKAVTQQAAYQANVTYSAVQPYSQQTYNAVLSGVHGQPDTGPAETLLFAFALASLGILVWGAIRAIRA